MNLAAYFCRQPIRPQEDHRSPERDDLLARRPEAARLATLVGVRQPYGWREEGPDYRLMANDPRGLYD